MWSGTECHSSAYSLPVPYVYRTARNLDDRFTWNRGSCGLRLEGSHNEPEPRLVCVRPTASAPLSDRARAALKAEAETTMVHSIE